MPRDGVDVAAQYLVYNLYTRGRSLATSWHPLATLGETAKTVARAEEHGWVILRDEGQGMSKERHVMLTDEGRVLARKALR